MAKLKPQDYEFYSITGDCLEFTSEIIITNDGVFNFSIPDELEETARDVLRNGSLLMEKTYKKINTRRTVRVFIPNKKSEQRRSFEYEDILFYRPRKYLKIISKSKELIEEFIKFVAMNYLTCEERTEKVILYSISNQVVYYKDQDGNIYPNGYICPNDSIAGSGNLNGSTGQSQKYSIGLAARVYDKTTYSRSSGERVEYSLNRDNYHLSSEKHLNAFIGLSGFNPDRAEEIPYSREAEMFFYDMMIGLCGLVDRLESFFSDKDNISKAIEANATPLLAEPLNNIKEKYESKNQEN